VESFNSENVSDTLKVALVAADKAAEISRAYYAGNFTVTTKSDMTPVTQADVDRVGCFRYEPVPMISGRRRPPDLNSERTIIT